MLRLFISSSSRPLSLPPSLCQPGVARCYDKQRPMKGEAGSGDLGAFLVVEQTDVTFVFFGTKKLVFCLLFSVFVAQLCKN